MNENQSGFRKGYCTLDNIFVLHHFFEILRLSSKKLYCVFIDFDKAFDNVWRPALWSKKYRRKMFQSYTQSLSRYQVKNRL